MKGLLEKVTTSAGTDYRHMIRAGGSTIVVSRQSSGSNAVHYVTSDHLGSSSVVTNGSGAVLVNSSFDAFGQRRGSNWSGTPNAGDWTAIAGTTRRGYTDHSMLDNLNLVHMNGRVQDPVLGRFMSADPFITEPMNTQNYNRYSYVYNNPISFTDPSGFDTHCPSKPYVTTTTPDSSVEDENGTVYEFEDGDKIKTTTHYGPGDCSESTRSEPQGGGGGSGGGGTPKKPDCAFDSKRAQDVRKSWRDPKNIKGGKYASQTEVISAAFFLGFQMEIVSIADFTTSTVHRFTTASFVGGVRFSASYQTGGGLGNRNYLEFSDVSASSWGGATGGSIIMGIGGAQSRDGIPGMGQRDNVTNTLGLGFDLGVSGSFGRTKYDGAWPIESLPEEFEDMGEFYKDAHNRLCKK